MLLYALYLLAVLHIAAKRLEDKIFKSHKFLLKRFKITQKISVSVLRTFHWSNHQRLRIIQMITWLVYLTWLFPKSIKYSLFQIPGTVGPVHPELYLFLFLPSVLTPFSCTTKPRNPFDIWYRGSVAREWETSKGIYMDLFLRVFIVMVFTTIKLLQNFGILSTPKALYSSYTFLLSLCHDNESSTLNTITVHLHLFLKNLFTA